MRALLVALTMIVGVAAVVAATAIQLAADIAINESFAQLGANEITVASVASDDGTQGSLPLGALERIRAIPGVTSATSLSNWHEQDTFLSPFGTLAHESRPTTVVSVGPDALQVLGGEIVRGREFGSTELAGGARVALVGESLSTSWGLEEYADLPFVEVNGTTFRVVGVVRVSGSFADLSEALWLSDSAVADALQVDPPLAIVADVATGTVASVSDSAATFANPFEPNLVGVDTPYAAERARLGVASSVGSLTAALLAIVLVVGAIGVAAMMYGVVSARQQELALRIALGGQRRHVFMQVLMESTLIGTIGALLGVVVGMSTAMVVQSARSWQLVIDTGVVAVAVCAGVLLAVVAGVVPALRAARAEPIVALRSG